MAIFSYNSLSTVAAILGEGDTLFVTQNGALFTENSDAVFSVSGTVSLTILGTVASGEGDGIDLNGGGTADINIGLSGYVGSNADNAVEVTGLGLELRNSGTLQGSTCSIQFVALTGVSGDVVISNSGAMIGTVQAVFSSAFDSFALTNTGSPQTTSSYAIQVLDGEETRIQNSGSIMAQTYAIYIETGTGVVFNSGDIRGHISGGGGGFSLVNTGTITGNVTSGSGNDTIDTRFGVITGFVSGSSGTDTYIIGDAYVRIVENPEGDNSTEDTVYSSVSYALTASLDALYLQGAGAVVGIGNSGNNTIGGSMADNRLAGRGGDDTLYGDGNGMDTMVGGRGNDSFFLTDGDDCVVAGGVGTDYAAFSSSNTDSMVVNLTTGTVVMSEGSHLISSVERVRTGAGADTLQGSGAGEELDGSSGNDRIVGAGGTDRLIGGSGTDTLTGGGQGDSFVFEFASYSAPGAARDIITDFTAAELIILTDIDAITGGGNNTFTFVGSLALNGAGQLRVEQVIAGNYTLIEGDVTGDGLADFQIELTGLITLTAANFAL